MRRLDYGAAYRYPHDEPNAYAAGQRYFPDGMPARRYYRPVPRGLESQIAEKLERLRGLDSAAAGTTATATATGRDKERGA